MARSTRDSKLETRSARLRLSAGARHHRAIASGLALGYRRSAQGNGTWHVRLLLGADRYVYQQLGSADDHQDADGLNTLTYFQAQDMARARMEAHRNTGASLKPYTVADAMEDYLAWYEAQRKSYRTTDLNVKAHILPTLGHRQIDQLTTPELRKWHETLAITPKRVRTKQAAKPATINAVVGPDYLRRRQQTANRILTILKAALNMAFRDERVKSDGAWRRVKPFRGVNRARVRALARHECVRLLNACTGQYRNLVKGALLTGCRYGEIISLQVADYLEDARCIYVKFSKSDKPRHVALSQEGQVFFLQMTEGKAADDLIFTRDDGQPWKKNHQVRPLHQACNEASIVPAISFHVLRHTYASQLAMAGIPLQMIAQMLGHADTRVTEQHYAHLQPSFVMDAVRAAMPPLEDQATVTPLTLAMPKAA